MKDARSRLRTGLVVSIACLVWAAAAVAIAAPAGAAALVVTTSADTVDPADGKLSLREAVGVANLSPGDHQIELSSGVIYQLTRCGPWAEDLNRYGDLDYLGSDQLSIVGNGATIEQTCTGAAGQPNQSGIEATDWSSSVLVLEDLTVTGAGLGAIYTARDLILDGVTVSGNSGGKAGGAAAQGTATITDSIFTNNEGTSGGLYAGHAAITGSTFSDNTGFYGGAMQVGDVTITDSQVSDNHAVHGGGIYATYGTITDTTINANSAYWHGGGGSFWEVTVDGSTLSGNVSGDGGALAAQTATIRDSTLTSNEAAFDGGGVYAVYSTTVERSTISENAAGSDGGGIISGIDVTISDSTLNWNEAGGSGGGVFADAVAVEGSFLSGNVAGDDGGGLYATGDTTVSDTKLNSNDAADTGGGAFSGGLLEMESSNVSGNSAATGGGLYSVGELDVARSEMVANSASVVAAAAASGTASAEIEWSTVDGNVTGATSPSLEAGDLYLYASTISDNVGGAASRGSMFVINSTVSANTNFGLSAPSMLTAYSTVTGNDVGLSGTDPSSGLVSVTSVVSDNGVDCSLAGSSLTWGYNYDTDATCGFVAVSDTSGGPSPALGPLGDNGGETLTHLPDPASPLIDVIPTTFIVWGSAACSGAAAALGEGVDQRGVTRPQGTGCDIGAAERE